MQRRRSFTTNIKYSEEGLSMCEKSKFNTVSSELHALKKSSFFSVSKQSLKQDHLTTKLN